MNREEYYENKIRQCDNEIIVKQKQIKELEFDKKAYQIALDN